MKRTEKLKNKNNKLVHSRTEQRKDPKPGRFLATFFSIVFLGAGIYLLFFSKLLDIKKVDVVGYSHPQIIEEIALSKINNNFMSRNILFFNSMGLRKILSGDSRIKEVEVEKKYPRSIVIKVTESKGEIIWVTAGDKFLISGRGDVVAKASNKEILPEIYDSANIAVSPGDKVASPTFINFIKVISEKFEAAAGAKISKIIIFDILTDIHVSTDSGWTVFFNASKDPETQLKNLSRVLDEARASGQTRLQYVDMRIDNRIFYK